MKKYFIYLLVIISIVTACKDNSVEPIDEPDTLPEILAFYRKEAKMPGIIGAIINNENVEVYSEGLRKIDNTIIISDSDKFHIGSNLKAISAMMIAKLVEEGQLNWQTKIIDVFPEFSGQIPSEFESITIHKLLTHRAGITAFENYEDVLSIPNFNGDIKQQRSEFCLWVLNNSDKTKIDSYQYSNGGYVIAAAMVERLSGMLWEDLMILKIFSQMNIQPVYSWPAKNNSSQPWGHIFENNIFIPFDPNGSVQWPEIFNPSGNLSLSIADYIKIIKLHLEGLNGNASIISLASYQFLHQPVGDYSCGWLEGTTQTGIKFSYHDGSDGTFYAISLMHPYLKRASIVFSNCDSENTRLNCTTAAIKILEKIR